MPEKENVHGCVPQKGVYKEGLSLFTGHAFDEIWRDQDGKWWATCKSYCATRIFFCPFCGVKLG